ncbi:aquaporin-9-like isoform X2 [Antedon mediterranea]|uniref:aquaporin-9-like isoform X2 n=1 Tax=Antedon mediterranea TaxID=105859 RepID=UPI003AF7DCF2
MGLWYETYLNPKRFSCSRNLSVKIFLSESVGMLMFVLIGCNQINYSESSYTTINLQIALGYTLGLCLCFENGGFLNPSIALVGWILGKIDTKELAAAVLAQFFGAICGAILMNAISYDNVPVAKETGFFTLIYERIVGKSENEVPSILAFFTKSALLMIGVMSIIDERGINAPKYLQPFMIGTILFSIGLTTNRKTYCFLNLAQDISPRIILSFFCKSCETPWAPYNQTAGGWKIEIFGPVIGTIIGAFIYVIFIELHHKPYDYVKAEDTDVTDDGAISDDNTYRYDEVKQDVDFVRSRKVANSRN